MQILFNILDKYVSLDKSFKEMISEMHADGVNGIEAILPEGHGRLIDADAYLIKERPRGIDEVIWKESHIYKSITETPTIIEKDKESE